MLVHEVVDYTAGGIGQVFIEVLGLAHELDGEMIITFFSSGEKEAFHAFFKFGHLFAGAAVGVHDEELWHTFYCVGEGDLSAFVDPETKLLSEPAVRVMRCRSEPSGFMT